MKKLLQIQTAGFILKPNDTEVKSIFLDIKSQFEARGIKVILAKRSADMIGEDGMDFNQMCEMSDFLVSLGGDGTLLSLVRRSYGFNKPVVGINAGNLGFLADITIDDVSNFLDQLHEGIYRIDDRMMIEGCVQSDDGTQKNFFAFNDVVMASSTPSKMVKVDASIDKEWFNTYKGDGLIISTPTGATAYNLAAGGPVMYPLTKAFIMTPICPHSLRQRPLVVPVDFSIELSTQENNIMAVVDGQDEYKLKSGDRLLIRGAKIGAKLLHREERNYFSVLREKLSWGDQS